MRRIMVGMLLVAIVVMQACSNDTPRAKGDIRLKEQPSAISIESVSIEVVEDKTLKVFAEATGEDLQYAYYVYRDEELLEKIAYEKSANQLNYLTEVEGLYKVRVFIRNTDGEKETKYTEEIEV